MDICQLLRPQAVYRLVDLQEWINLPIDPILLAIRAGEFRHIGEGPLEAHVLGNDIMEFVAEHGLRYSLTPAGRAALFPAAGGTAPGTTAVSASEVQLIPLDAIRITDNPREKSGLDDESLDGLANSIRRVGLLTPILVTPRGDGFVLVAGERRLRAVRDRLGWTAIAATCRILSDLQIAEARLLENLIRENLSPLEEAAGLHGLLQDHGHSLESLAALIGRPTDAVRRREQLLTLPAAWQKRIEAGTLNAAAAEYLVDWARFPQVLSDMERFAGRKLTLITWKAKLIEAVRKNSRALEGDDGPSFTPDEETTAQLDIVTLNTRPGRYERRAMHVDLWERLEQAAETATVLQDDGLADTGDYPETEHPADSEHVPFWERIGRFKSKWVRTLIVDRLQTLSPDELTGLAELLEIDLAAEWSVSEEFLRTHTRGELGQLADEVGVDLSPARNVTDAWQLMLHARPTMPSCLMAVDGHVLQPV